MNSLVMLIVSIVDLPSLVTLYVSVKTPKEKFWRVFVCAVLMGVLGEAINVMVRPTYQLSEMIVYRIIGQVIVGGVAYQVAKFIKGRSENA